MGEKIMTARKDYKCGICGKQIKKGDKYIYGATRIPVYEYPNDFEIEQIGIEYVKWRHHLIDDCELQIRKENDGENYMSLYNVCL